MSRKLRRAGSQWRLLAHGDFDGKFSNEAHGVEIPGTEFDELVVGKWIHIEQMDTGHWWMDIGGVTVRVKADRDGRPLSVAVYGPGDYADAVDGCSYSLTWNKEQA
jgi:hypothetical protein